MRRQAGDQAFRGAHADFPGRQRLGQLRQERITVTALGESARNQEGQVEAWFDPAQAVTLRLVQLGGKTTVRKGKLPIHTSVVVKDKEYLYSVVEGTQRGFVEITGDRCNYP